MRQPTGMFKWPEWLPERQITALYATVANRYVPRRLRSVVYRAFGRAVGVNFGEVELPLESYERLNDFFVRRLKPGLRPRLASEAAWSMPADGRLDQCAKIRDGELIQAKGIKYDVSSFLDDSGAAERFEGGVFATVYLSPKDYHRVHAPCRMEVTEIIHLGGRLLPVNGLTVPSRPDTFVDNERIILRFVDDRGCRGAYVMVAALGVGCMTLNTDQISLTTDHTTVRDHHVLDTPWVIEAHEEVGAFHLGSTVVLVAQEDARWQSLPETGRAVRVGEHLLGPAD